jgi:predicted nucleic acid-binding protein
VVKWFVEEERSADVERLRRDATGAVSQLTQVELVSALARRHREGAISSEALKDLLTTSAEALDSVLVVGLSEAVTDRARDLLLRQPLRAADAIQLASCLDLQGRLQETVRFLAFDQRLNEAAAREGLTLAV